MTRLVDAVLPRALGLRVKRLAAALDGYRKHPAHAGGGGRRVGGSPVALRPLLLLGPWTLGVDIPLQYFMLFLLPSPASAAMLPVSLGGLGVRDGTMVLLFQEVGVRGADILAVSLGVYPGIS